MTQAGVRPRIGYVGAGADLASPLVTAFRDGLREHGYIEGKNVEVEYRLAALQPDRYPRLVEELLDARVDVIVTADSEATPVARQATRTIPIVMSVAGDPVGEGLVASLDRPGGNVTGLTNLSSTLSHKRLELLQQATQPVSRVAVLWNAQHPGVRLAWGETQQAALDLGLELISVPVEAAQDLTSAFDGAVRQGAGALLVLTDRLLTFHRREVVALANDRRLPGMYG